MDSMNRIDFIALPPRDEVSEQAKVALVHLDMVGLLIIALIGAAGATLFAAGDVYLNLKAFGARFANELGEATDLATVYGTTTITIGAFLLIGASWLAGKRRIATAGYTLLFAFLVVLLLPVLDGFISESMSGFGAPAFGGGSGATIPTWLFALLVGLLTLGFTVPGLCLCACEFVLAGCWVRWMMRREAKTKLRMRQEARTTIARRNRLVELRKENDMKAAGAWTEEILLEYRRQLEAKCTEYEAISRDGCNTRDQRQQAYQQLIQTRRVIASLDRKGDAQWTDAQCSALH